VPELSETACCCVQGARVACEGGGMLKTSEVVGTWARVVVTGVDVSGNDVALAAQGAVVPSVEGRPS
jgi:hypothetical protein